MAAYGDTELPIGAPIFKIRWWANSQLTKYHSFRSLRKCLFHPNFRLFQIFLSQLLHFFVISHYTQVDQKWPLVLPLILHSFHTPDMEVLKSVALLLHFFHAYSTPCATFRGSQHFSTLLHRSVMKCFHSLYTSLYGSVQMFALLLHSFTFSTLLTDILHSC